LAQRFEKFHSLKSLADTLIGLISTISLVVEAIPLMYFFSDPRQTPPMRTVIEPFLVSLARRGSRKKGQTLVEYALILAVLTIVMVAVFSLLGARIVVIFSAITNLLDTAQSSH
jgi:Flp pilus assembly pilin Flp